MRKPTERIGRGQAGRRKVTQSPSWSCGWYQPNWTCQGELGWLTGTAIPTAPTPNCSSPLQSNTVPLPLAFKCYKNVWHGQNLTSGWGYTSSCGLNCCSTLKDGSDSCRGGHCATRCQNGVANILTHNIWKISPILTLAYSSNDFFYEMKSFKICF